MLTVIAGLMALLSSLLGRARAIFRLFADLFLWGKAFVNGVSPLLTLAGGALTLLGLKRNDKLLTVLAGFTLWRNLTYILRVTRNHHGFDGLFDEAALPNNGRFLRRRFTFPPPPQPVMMPHRNIPVGPATDEEFALKADLWEPPDTVTRSGLGIVYLHGSAWHYLHKDFAQFTRPMFAHLAAQGHTILDIDYTKAPRADVWQMVAEAQQGVAWLKREMKLDDIVLMGTSAGGHLALLTAYNQNPTPAELGDVGVKGVIATSAISDFFALHASLQAYPLFSERRVRWMTKLGHWAKILPAYAPEMVQTQETVTCLMGASPEDAPEAYAQASPIYHVGAHCPPTLLLHGEADTVTECKIQSEILAEEVRLAGGTAVCITYPQTQHAMELVFPRLAPVAQAHLYEIERFLAWLQTQTVGTYE